MAAPRFRRGCTQHLNKKISNSRKENHIALQFACSLALCSCGSGAICVSKSPLFYSALHGSSGCRRQRQTCFIQTEIPANHRPSTARKIKVLAPDVRFTVVFFGAIDCLKRETTTPFVTNPSISISVIHNITTPFLSLLCRRMITKSSQNRSSMTTLY